MKKLLILLIVGVGASVTLGCGGSGPSAATKEEGDQSMGATMEAATVDPTTDKP